MPSEVILGSITRTVILNSTMNMESHTLEWSTTEISDSVFKYHLTPFVCRKVVSFWKVNFEKSKFLESEFQESIFRCLVVL